MSASIEKMNIEANKKIIEEMLEVYPDKAKKDRVKHYEVAEQSVIESGKCAVKSNIKTRPGVMTARGCSFAGSKGVVWGPIKDAVHISHGPVGCGQYSWGTRRNYASGTQGVDAFGVLQVTSDFVEKDIVFGGDKKLETICREITEIFPLSKAISVQSECPVGLIGDDIEAVGKKMTKELQLPVIPVRCEGFRGVSQSLGHHIANDAVRDHLLGKGEFEDTTPYDINMIGEYNIGGDTWASRKILEEVGLRVIGQWAGDGTINELSISHKAKLNILHCYRSMNYICTTMEERYGIPWTEYNFFGPTKIAESLRHIATYFDDYIKENVERVIAKYEKEAEEVVAKYRPKLDGKKVMLMVGGLRAGHTIGAYEDLGMKVISTGYEFGHKDDYQRMIKEVQEGTIIYDDPTSYEMETLAEKLDTDLVGAGIKEKYVYTKMGIPFRQMHSWDYSGPYHGYDGFKVFARDMDMAINSPTWDLIKAPF